MGSLSWLDFLGSTKSASLFAHNGFTWFRLSLPSAWHEAGIKWLSDHRQHLKMNFLDKKLLYLAWNFTDFCSWGSTAYLLSLLCVMAWHRTLKMPFITRILIVWSCINNETSLLSFNHFVKVISTCGYRILCGIAMIQFCKNACINTIEDMMSYTFFQKLWLCESVFIFYTKLKAWYGSSLQPLHIKGVHKGFWCWACTLLSENNWESGGGEVSWWGQAVANSPNSKQDLQCHCTDQYGSVVLWMFTSCVKLSPAFIKCYGSYLNSSIAWGCLHHFSITRYA